MTANVNVLRCDGCGRVMGAGHSTCCPGRNRYLLVAEVNATVVADGNGCTVFMAAASPAADDHGAGGDGLSPRPSQAVRSSQIPAYLLTLLCGLAALSGCAGVTIPACPAGSVGTFPGCFLPPPPPPPATCPAGTHGNPPDCVKDQEPAPPGAPPTHGAGPECAASGQVMACWDLPPGSPKWIYVCHSRMISWFIDPDTGHTIPVLSDGPLARVDRPGSCPCPRFPEEIALDPSAPACPAPSPSPAPSCTDPGENLEKIVGAKATMTVEVDRAVVAVAGVRPDLLKDGSVVGWPVLPPNPTEEDGRKQDAAAAPVFQAIAAELVSKGVCGIAWKDALAVWDAGLSRWVEFHLIGYGAGHVGRADETFKNAFRPKGPQPSPSPAPPPVANACPVPTPGPLARWEAKVHNRGPNWTTLDSTPLVGADAEFCKAIGFTDGRRYCPPRAEGTPQAIVRACNELVVGQPGEYPAWWWNGQLVGPDGLPDGVAHDDNPYHLLVRPSLHGTATVCGQNSVCGGVTL